MSPFALQVCQSEPQIDIHLLYEVRYVLQYWLLDRDMSLGAQTLTHLPQITKVDLVLSPNNLREYDPPIKVISDTRSIDLPNESNKEKKRDHY